MKTNAYIAIYTLYLKTQQNVICGRIKMKDHRDEITHNSSKKIT